MKALPCMFRLPIAVMSVLIATSNLACEKEPASQPLMLSQEPTGATSIIAMKSESPVGGRVVVRGRIGGKAKPFSDTSDEFMMMDLSIPYCGEGETDGGCPQPWDYCCEKKEVKQAAGVTARIPTATWQSQGFSPLKPLMEVLVVGRRISADDPCVIEVDGVFIVSTPADESPH